MIDTVNILGTDYKITIKKYDEEPYFEKNGIDGYCDEHTKEIVICDMKTYKGWEDATEEEVKIRQKETLRHEIVHAFFRESGLSDSSFTVEGAWAKNEEMVDWFALQGPKIYKAWKKVDAI